jgi:DNA-directed RNA polymerase sigma subunit (sigma70/sigma32)
MIDANKVAEESLLPRRQAPAQPEESNTCRTRFARRNRPGPRALTGTAAARNGRGAGVGEPGLAGRTTLAAEATGALVLYLRAVGRVQALTRRAEARLVAQIKQGSRPARQRLLKASLRRVVELSREYENLGLPLLDLVAEGNLGLLKALEHFDPAAGKPFSSYSTWWIKQSIKRALAANAGPHPLSDDF